MTPSMKIFAIGAIPCIAVTGTAVAGSYGTRQDLVNTAVAAGSFDTLVAAVKAARWSIRLKELVHSLCSLQLTKHLQSYLQVA